MNHSDNFPPPKLIETLLVRNDFQFFPVCRVFSISCGVFSCERTLSCSWVFVLATFDFGKRQRLRKVERYKGVEEGVPCGILGNFSARDYRNLLTLPNIGELSWSWIDKKNVQVQKEKDKFVVCLCSAHTKKCTARPRPVFNAVFVAQNTIFTDFKSL